MKNLINDVLDLTRSRLGGGINLQIEYGRDLAPTMRQVIDELQVAYPDRAIDDHFDLTEPVDCDHERLGQLLSNLVGNALSYGAAGMPIKVEAITRDGELRISVSNAGEPIPHADNGAPVSAVLPRRGPALALKVSGWDFTSLRRSLRHMAAHCP